MFRDWAVFGMLCTALVSRLGAAEAPSTFDGVIYGGTPAGLAAAIAAAREGRSVVVLEPTRWIGGMVTGGLSSTDTGREHTIGGIAREFFIRAAAVKPDTPLWRAEPQANLATFEAMLREAKVRWRTSVPLKSVQRAETRITSLTTADGRAFAGRVFIDASYEGDLMAAARVSYAVGGESREHFGESLAGFYPMPVRAHDAAVMASTCPCVGGGGPHYIHGTPAKIAGRDAPPRQPAPQPQT